MFNRSNKKIHRSESRKLTIELVDESDLKITTTWPKGQDVVLFSQLLAYLCTGKLTDSIAESVAVHAAQSDDIETGAVIYAALQKVGAANTAMGEGSQDKPLVCPTQAIRLNMLPFGQ
jgi:hypothetical protein